MAGFRDRFAASLPSRSTWTQSRLAVLTVVIVILTIGVLAVLIVQPAPRTYAEGWSEPQTLDQVRLGELHSAAMDGQDNIHLVWLKQVVRKLVAYYAKLDRDGRILVAPIALSDPDANAEDVALVLTAAGEPLAFWIGKSGESEPQRLMMARPGSGEAPQVLSSSSRIMRDLAVTSDRDGDTYLVWSDNRDGLYDLYMTVFDSQGQQIVPERRVTDSGDAFVYDPVVSVGGNIVHLIYFSDEVVREYLMHQTLSPEGDTLTEPQVLEQMEQMAQQLGGEGTQLDLQLTAVADEDGGLRLYESLGPLVRLRRISPDGQAEAIQTLLEGSGYYSRVDVVRGAGQDWLVWADTRRRDQDRFQVYAAPLDASGQVLEESRLTYALSSALWPVMLVDSGGGRHLIWQQSVGPYTYELMYSDDLHPAPISLWQRLGFTGEDGPLSFLVALAQSAVFAVITLAVNAWRLVIAWGLAALAYLFLRRFEAVKPYLLAITWAVLLLALFFVARPEVKTLGQMPIQVSGAAHWVMGIAASALVLFLGWVWRDEIHGVLIWAGMAGLWLLCYYFLNLMLIFREGFAV